MDTPDPTVTPVLKQGVPTTEGLANQRVHFKLVKY